MLLIEKVAWMKNIPLRQHFSLKSRLRPGSLIPAAFVVFLKI